MAETLERALALWQRGFNLIPVPRPDGRHDGKVPAIAWKRFQTERVTETQVRAWFAEPMNLAIITGRISGVVVVDLDSRDALRWWTRQRPYTPWQTQTRRGFHVFYRHPGVPVPNRSQLDTGAGTLKIDVRGDGGFVIGPGSRHQTGHVYTEAGDWSAPLDQVPRFWPGWCPKPTATPVSLDRTVRPRPTGDLIDRARRYLAAVPRPEIGRGSDAATLYAACRLVRGFELSGGDAEALLWEWAGSRPGWTRDWIAAKVAHAIKYGSEPIGALR